MGPTRLWWYACVVVFVEGCAGDKGAENSQTHNESAGTTTGGPAGGIGGATTSSMTSGGLGGVMGTATVQTSSTSGGTPITSASSTTTGNSSGVGGSNTGTGNVGGAGAPVVSNLTIEPNPNSTISAYVSWTTDEPANSEVQFGIGEVEFRIVSDELVTDHRVLVIGMYADSDYVIKAFSTNMHGAGSAEGAFATGSLPSEVPMPTLSVNEPNASQSGWTLTNHMVGTGSGSFGSVSPPVIVMYDELGVPVWYYINGDTNDGRGDISVQLTPENTIVIGPGVGEAPREIDLAGNILWEGPSNVGGDAMTHHAGKLPNGNFVVIRDTSSGQLTGATIQEYDQDNQVAWSWNLLEHTTPPGGTMGDWCHGNSVTVDLDADFVYLNCRFLGLYKVSRSSGEIIWHMGGTYADDVPGDFTYSPPAAQFSDAHDPEIQQGGTILFYDNGGYTGALGNTGNFHSRVLEYAIDEATHTATLVWEFPGSFPVDSWYTDTWYSPYWGDADRLENDNILVTASVKNGEVANRIFEVTREGEVVWELISPIDVGSYRALRLSPPPLVQRIQ